MDWSAADSGLTPGQRIRLYRKRAGLTQEVCAGLKGCTVSAWRKWESGERQVVSLADWIEIARIVRQRDLFRLTGLPVGELPDDPPEHPLVAPVRRALLVPPNRADQLDLASAVDRAWDVWHVAEDNHDRVGRMLPDLVAQARATGDAGSAARLWMLLRAWAKWVGAHDLSMIAAERGIAAAADAGDPVCEAAAAWNAGMMLSTRGLAEESADVARRGVAALTPHSTESGEALAMLGALQLLLAVEYSRLRDEHRVAQALDEADRIAGLTGARNVYRTVFGPVNVKVYAAQLALDRGRAADAIRIAERIETTALPSMERRYAATFTLARAHAQRGDDLAAAVCLRRAHAAYTTGAAAAPAFRAVVRELLRRETPSTRPELRPLATAIGIA